MATIHRYPFFSHATSSATRALFQGRRGKLVNRGAGASFWFRPLDTSLSEVPVDDMEFGNIFRVTTSDRQEVSVQTALTVRIAAPELTARRVDFEIDQRTGEWTGQPLQNLQNRLAESAKQFAAEVAAREPLRTILDENLSKNYHLPQLYPTLSDGRILFTTTAVTGTPSASLKLPRRDQPA